MGDRTEDQTQQQTEGQQPANQAGNGTEDEAALWAEFDAAEKADAGEAPPEGRDAAADANGGSPDKDADQDAAAAPADKAGNAQQTTPQNDIWAAAPPELRSAFEETRRRAEQAEHRFRSDAGRIAALQRQVDEARKGIAAPGTAAGTTQDGEPKSVLESDELKAIKQEYPEIVAPFEAALAQLEGRIHRHEKELSAIGTDRRQAAQNEQLELVRQRHPTFETDLAANSAQFLAWKDQQPRYVQEAIQRNWDGIVDGYEFDDILSRFKSSLGGNSGSPGQEPPGKGTSQPLADRRKRQLESSASPRSRGPSVASGIPEDADEETIWKMYDEEDRRKAARR